MQRMLAVMLLFAASLVAVAAPVWEKVAATPMELVETPSQEIADARVVDGAIVLTLNSASTVKVFTILGQLVAQQKLEAGTWRLPLSSRGIYILKAGSSTKRITL